MNNKYIKKFNSKIHLSSYGTDTEKSHSILIMFKANKVNNEYIGPFCLYSMSPFGVQFDITNCIKEHKLALKIDSIIDIEVKFLKKTIQFKDLIVMDYTIINKKEIIGLRWRKADLEHSSNEERRFSERFTCNNDFLPTGVAINQFQTNDSIFFNIIDISHDGMQIVTSLRNRLLIPGLTLESTIIFPPSNQIKTNLKIANIRTGSKNGREVLILGTKISPSSKELIELGSQYLLQFGPKLTPKMLRINKMVPKSVASALEFCFVRTEEEYRQVLSLRKQAYAAAGKVPEDLKEDQMGDEFDDKSLICLAKHHGKAVGSFRVIFLNPGEQTEHEKFTKFPSHFPDRAQMLNASRLCTHPDYRSSDLFFELIRQMAFIVIRSKKRWLVSGCNLSLLPIYERFGFKGTNVRFKHGDLGATEEELILWDVVGSVQGRVGSLNAWNRTYSDLFQTLIAHGELKVSWMDRIRAKIFSTFT